MNAKKRRLSRGAKARQLEGSRRGSEAVREVFSSEITRRRFCDVVGIHPTTLSKWEKLGVVSPHLVTIMNSPTMVFSAADIEFGEKLITLLKARSGEISIKEAAAIVRAPGRGDAQGRVQTRRGRS